MTGTLARYSDEKISFLNRNLLPYGVRFSGINSRFRKIELPNIDLLAKTILNEAKLHHDSVLSKDICKHYLQVTASRKDRYRFFRSTILEVRKFGVAAPMRTFGPDQIKLWEERINADALMKIWPKIHANFNYDYIKPLLREDYDHDKMRSSSPAEIRRFLQANPVVTEKIIYLDLSNLSLKVLPLELSFFKNVTMLDLCDNHLISLGTSLNQMTALKILHVSNNQLTTFLRMKIPQLVVLNACDNKLSKPQFEPLPNLETLTLAGNQLTVFPACVDRLPKLKDLNVSENKLTKLPRSTRSLKYFKKINIEKNHLTKRPTWLDPSIKLINENNTPPPVKTYDLRPRKKQKIQ
ncbi:MAG: leucine-rich repeat domain-containing protein [Candidatus Melainabacteria bacterium]|nr:leucine-rich repeat domain-containing protein [Candidatus Melainabacteria bacterium]